MSDIKILEQRALEIRRKYDELNRSKNGEAWDALKLAKGFKKDVTDLISIIEAKNVNQKKLAHELGDCLWSVLVIARKLDVDLERSFWTTMGELEQRFKDGAA